jgi:tRNA (mo5U34)-methyltransferase
MTRSEWLRHLVEREPYFFHKIELPNDLVTPGWSDPKTEKLPFYGLPEDMTGMRVLDIGCAEGFFSFEAERRGAREIVAIDSFPDSVRRFNICREAFDSNAQAFLTNVYDLSERTFGTFDLVMFFGVLYHLRHPLLAMEKVFNVCSGTVLVQTANFENEALGGNSAAEFHPFGIQSGPPEAPLFDPTVFWVPNAACVRDMMAHVGFVDIEGGHTATTGAVFRAEAPAKSPGAAPDQMKAPWC